MSDSIQRYTAAWNADNPRDCMRLLTESWVTDGEFQNVGLDSPLVGVEDLATYIGATNATFPGHRTVLAGAIVHHNSFALVSWRYLGPDGLVTLEGQNFVEFDAVGLIRRVIQFFPVPLAP